MCVLVVLEAVNEVVGEVSELGNDSEVVAVELRAFLPIALSCLVRAGDIDAVPLAIVRGVKPHGSANGT